MLYIAPSSAGKYGLYTCMADLRTDDPLAGKREHSVMMTMMMNINLADDDNDANTYRSLQS